MIDRPLKPQWFQILLALSTQDRHGYGIQRAVLEQTEGHMRLWPTMLYRSLSRLSAAGLISPVDAPDEDLEDERRQYYTLTTEGRAVLAEEAQLLARWAAAALENGL
jgi:DNA-binding PadR family transcriptional regulator